MGIKYFELGSAILEYESLNTLRSLVEQQISIRDAFREAIGEYYQVVGKADGKISYSTATFETLSAENEFPEPGLLLDNDFVENKVRAEIIREASH